MTVQHRCCKQIAVATENPATGRDVGMSHNCSVLIHLVVMCCGFVLMIRSVVLCHTCIACSGAFCRLYKLCWYRSCQGVLERLQMLASVNQAIHLCITATDQAVNSVQLRGLSRLVSPRTVARCRPGHEDMQQGLLSNQAYRLLSS